MLIGNCLNINYLYTSFDIPVPTLTYVNTEITPTSITNYYLSMIDFYSYINSTSSELATFQLKINNTIYDQVLIDGLFFNKFFIKVSDSSLVSVFILTTLIIKLVNFNNQKYIKLCFRKI